MLASTLLLVLLLCAGVLIKVPYAEMSPGPTVNTLGEHDGDPVLNITGTKTYPTSGHLNMTTVRVTSADYHMNLFEAVYGWLAHDDAVVPYAILYPDDKSADEVDQQNAEEFSQSQESAKVAALNELDIDVTSRVVVSSVIADGPAHGKLHAGDVITEVDGVRVTEPADVVKRVTDHRPGEPAEFTVVPADKVEKVLPADQAEKDPKNTRKVTITTGRDDESDRAVVGIEAGARHVFPFQIDIKLADVGGPSAGLMFALGIVDKLTPEDLTGGEFVAGTGTIDSAGEVGAIGGIRMKTVAARAQGAEYFLTPKENCASAASDKPGGLTLIEVSTLKDALKALQQIRDGDTDGLKRCSPE